VQHKSSRWRFHNVCIKVGAAGKSGSTQSVQTRQVIGVLNTACSSARPTYCVDPTVPSGQRLAWGRAPLCSPRRFRVRTSKVHDFGREQYDTIQVIRLGSVRLFTEHVIQNTLPVAPRQNLRHVPLRSVASAALVLPMPNPSVDPSRTSDIYFAIIAACVQCAASAVVAVPCHRVASQRFATAENDVANIARAVLQHRVRGAKIISYIFVVFGSKCQPQARVDLPLHNKGTEQHILNKLCAWCVERQGLPGLLVLFA